MNDKKPSKKIGADDKSLAHNPFAALAGLSAPAAPASSSTTAPQKETKEKKRFSEKVVVRKEKKGHGGKTVTVVSGVLPAFREEIASALKKAMGTGARVEGDDVVMQGDLVDRVMAALEKEGAKKLVKGG